MHPNFELYAGIWGWSTKLPTNPTGEFDLYGGIRPTIGPFAFDFGFMYYWYPREAQQFLDPTGTIIPNCYSRRHDPHARQHRLLGSLRQGHLDGDRLAGDQPLRLLRRRTGSTPARPAPTRAARQGHAAVGLVPDRLGRVRLGRGRALLARHGHQLRAVLRAFDLPDYTYWNVGFGATYKVVTFDLRYHDTDLTPDAVLRRSPAIRAASRAVSRSGAAQAIIGKLSFDLTLNNNIK